MKRKLLLAVALATLFGLNTQATDWTDKTSLITNPSFETDEAISDLTNAANRKAPTGWTVVYDTGTANNNTQQWGTANASSNIYSKAGAGTFTPSAGDKFFHLRENWHGSTTYEISQVLAAANLPVGVYKLSAKIATSASAATDYTLSIQEEGGTAVVSKQNRGGDAYSWQDWTVVAYKSSAATTLTIKATMKGGSDKNSHWCMLVDDFKLEYAAIEDVATDNTLDVTAAITNPSFEWGNTEGWTTQGGSGDTGARANSDGTYTTSGADGNFVYNTWQNSSTLYKVSQTIFGLPSGYYQLTALVASDANQNIQVYCGNGKVYDSAADKGTGKTVTTPVAYIDGRVEIGATSYNWFKVDNFRLTYLGTDFTPSAVNPLAVTDKANLAWNVNRTTIQWGIQFREVYSNDPTTIANDVLTQTISNLDNGNYKVKLWAEASYAKNNGVADSDVPAGTHVATLYANDATADVNLEIQTGVAGGTLNSYTLDAQVTGHTLKIGMNAIAAGANWKIIQIENLLYTGPLDLTAYKATYDALVAEAGTAKTAYSQVVGKELADLNAKLAEEFDTTSPDEYETINSALRTLIDAFAAAASNYDLLATEKTKAAALGMTTEEINTAAATTKTGLLALQDLKVAEYNYVNKTYTYEVELGEWSSTATGTSAATFSNEHWSGTTHEYKNQNDNNGQGWNNSNGWSINFSQDVSLPAGNYVFKVAGRQASGNNVTTSLVVKNGETELGSVNDFPRSNSSRGINKSGETSFNETDDKYANNGNGYGWEWRYVKFTLDEAATVNIAINSVATGGRQWVSFGDYTVRTDNEANISLIAYNVALANAKTIIADETYANVAGTDKSALQTAIAADETLDRTDADAIDAATTALNTAASTFTAGVVSWNAYVLAKGYGEAINATALPYATSEKLDAVATALRATVNTAADATTAAAAINTANRAAYESNGIAENVSGAKDRTSLITNADGSAVGGWSGSFWTATAEAYTEANGNTTNTYFDKNGVKSFTSSQTIKLRKGQYILSVTARAQVGIDSYKMQVTNNADETAEVALTAMGNADGVFNRGWNDFTVAFEQKADGDATITITADNTESDANFWMSWDRFRLYSLSEAPIEISENADFVAEDIEGIGVTLTRNIKAGINTLVLPFAMTQAEVEAAFGEGSKVYTIASYDAEKSNVVFDVASGIAANKPCLLEAAAAGTSYSFEDRTIVVGTATDAVAGIELVGSYAAATTVPTDSKSYVVSGGKLYLVDSAVTNLGTRAYFHLTEETAAKSRVLALSFGGETTGIATVGADGVKVETGVIYNLNGQRVAAPSKGIYIVNGKKVLFK